MLASTTPQSLRLTTVSDQGLWLAPGCLFWAVFLLPNVLPFSKPLIRSGMEIIAPHLPA